MSPGRPEQITEENVLKVNIEDIALDRRFVDVTFNNARKITKSQKWFLEAEELNFTQQLIDSDVSRLVKMREELRRLIEDVLLFDTRTTRQNALAERDNLQQRIDGYYNEVYQFLPMKVLPFLRQEAARIGADVKELERQQNAAANAEKRYQKLAENLESRLSELEQRKDEIQKSEAEVVAVGLGKYFEDQAKKYGNERDGWLEKRNKIFMGMYVVVGINLILYILLFLTNQMNVWPHLAPDNFFTPQYGLAKLAFLLLMSYGVGFSAKNYNITSGLSATNTHRKNVAETLLHALSSPIDASGKAELMRVAADVMFTHLSVGYIKKENMGDSGPISEFINRISSARD